MNHDKARFFDEQVEAPWAATEYGDEERPKIGRLMARAGLAPGQTVLEPGCGTGRLSLLLARAVGEKGKVVALDISAGMVRACQAKVASLPQVEVLQAGAEGLPGSGAQRLSFLQLWRRHADRVTCLVCPWKYRSMTAGPAGG